MRAPSTVKQRVVAVALVLVVLAFALPASPVPHFLAFMVAPIEGPLLSFGNALGSGFLFPVTLFRSKRALEEENRDLQSKIALLTSNGVRNETLQNENDLLRGALGRTTGKRALKLATVLAGEERSLYGTMIIDLGTNDGVTLGSLVLVNPSLVLGVIEEADTNLAKVRLFSRSGEKTQAFVGANKLELVGRGSGNYEVDLPHDAVVAVGDGVRLAPSPVVRADDLVLGTVKTVEKGADSTHVRVTVPLNIHALMYVFVTPQ